MSNSVAIAPNQINPSLALDVTPPATTNPLGLAQSAAGTISALTQAKQFQSEFAAKQRAGQIIAASPDYDTAASALQRDPLVSAFAPEAVGQMRAAANSELTYQGEGQRQGLEGVGVLGKQLPAGILDRGAIPALVSTAIANAKSPAAKASLGTFLDAFHTSMTEGLPSDPAATQAEQSKRLVAFGSAFGATPDQFAAVMPRPGTVATNTGTQVGTFAPAALGNAFAPAGGSPTSFVPAGLGPQVAGAGQAVVGGGNTLGGGGGAAASNGGAAPNPLGVPAIQRPPGGQGGATGVSPPSAQAAPDGTPIIPPNYTPPAPPHIGAPGSGTGGSNVLSPQQSAIAATAAQQYADSTKPYNNAVSSLGTLSYMDNEISSLAKQGGWLTPGSGGEARENIAKAVNTVWNVFGGSGSPPIDPSGVADAEAIYKGTRTMGAQLLSNLTGQSHQAAQTIESLTAAVPGLDNTPLGAKLLINTYSAIAQRTVAERQFDNWYMQQPNQQGNLINAETEFNRLHPPEATANKVLGDLGMSANGFSDPSVVANYVRQGYLSRDQGAKILQQHFPSQFAPAGGQ